MMIGIGLAPRVTYSSECSRLIKLISKFAVGFSLSEWDFQELLPYIALEFCACSEVERR